MHNIGYYRLDSSHLRYIIDNMRAMGRGNVRRCPEVSFRSLALVLTLASLLPVARAGFIDIETPLDRRTTTSQVDGTTYHLVRTVQYLLTYCELDRLALELAFAKQHTR